jgi:hypothetical protein
MPRAEHHIALVLGLPGAYGVGLLENDLQSALELTRTLAVPIPSAVARAPNCRRAER